MKKIILYGAFDRYNFGDNLMPIVFETFFKKCHPEAIENFEFIYSSISSSNLSRYLCLKTQSINDVVKYINDGDIIVVVGGEVLCADSLTLFTHMPKPKKINDLLRFLNKVPHVNFILRNMLSYIYHAPWSYPYIPDKSLINKDVKVIYNTVGGGIQHLDEKNKKNITSRLNEANFISVRDSRTYEDLNCTISDIVYSPDSVYLISSLYNECDIISKVREKIRNSYDYDYIIFQAAPDKVGFNIDFISEKLRIISRENNKKIILLPIGYASGHDDFYFLKDLHALIPECSELVYDLNVWEILYMIKNSEAYIGTSLHGAIVAMSYGLPHYGLNENIKKLDAFLKNWSVKPFNRCYSIDEIVDIIPTIDNVVIDSLRMNNNKNFKLIERNFEIIFNVITS
ncbi:polysaccharide pyruvyl transferase family protein [Vibrio hibernica]|uniref:polysaccharide pyruvyl transferase family protein n=1 Tax=Vibrio hibernica TaxID=2587465 RepID=UPI00187F1CC3|nr:polysaccharide pyruvyl transferase family protein [Vibrio hibernica]